MKTKWMYKILGQLAVIAFVIAMSSPFLAAQKPDSSSDKPDSVAINNLLADAKTHATRLQEDSDELVMFTRSSLAWQTHADKLRAMKEDVNQMGKILTQMQGQRAEGSAWQQVAIDRIHPLLQDMADQLTATIEYLNKHQSQVNMPPYADYAHANYDLASRTSSLVSDLVEYGKAKSDYAREEKLGQKLELPAKSSN